MRGDPEGLVTFQAGGKKYTAVLGLRAEKAVEAHYDLPYLRAIASIMPDLTPEDLENKTKVLEASLNIRYTEMARLFEFALLKFHRDLSEDEIEEIWDDLGGVEEAAGIVARCLTAALGLEGDDSSSKNPTSKRPRKKTGSRS